MMSKFINLKNSRERSLIINAPKYEEKVIIFYFPILSPPEKALWQKISIPKPQLCHFDTSYKN